jgi:hypothetical protein
MLRYVTLDLIAATDNGHELDHPERSARRASYPIRRRAISCVSSVGARTIPGMQMTIRDETATGRQTGFIVLDIPQTITLRELIRLRVREEVARYNAHPTERFNGLVKPTDAEEDLNGYRMRQASRIDWERQADAAIEAFGRNGFFVLVGDRQVEELDEPLDLDDASDVAFVRLVPLVGG